MATAGAAAKTRRSGSPVPNGKAKTATARSCAARCARPPRAVVSATLRRQGIVVGRSRSNARSAAKPSSRRTSPSLRGSLATMMRAGVPLLQSFDIVARGSDQPSHDQIAERHSHGCGVGHQLSTAFRKHPIHFDALYCNLVKQVRLRVFWNRCWIDWLFIRKKTVALKQKIKAL